MVDSTTHAARSRRFFLRSALLVCGSLGLLGSTVFLRRGIDQQRLTRSGKQVLRGIARGVFSDLLPQDAAEREAALDRHVAATETLLAGLPPGLRSEMSLVLGALGAAPSRVALTGMVASWDVASVEQLHAALETLRLSPLQSARAVYRGLHDLNCVSFFSDPANWSLIGYHGASG